MIRSSQTKTQNMINKEFQSFNAHHLSMDSKPIYMILKSYCLPANTQKLYHNILNNCSHKNPSTQNKSWPQNLILFYKLVRCP